MIARLLGRLRRIFWPPKFREAGFEIRTEMLPDDGEVQFAAWHLKPYDFPVLRAEQVSFYRRYIKPGDFAVDIGPQEGDTTIPIALAAGPSGMVLAIEANPHAHKVLLENARLNPDKTNIIALNFAAAADDSMYTFGSGDPSFINGGLVGYSSNKPAHSHFRFRVQGRNLAQFLEREYQSHLGRLSFIKMDLEGYDKEVLKNLSGILARYRPSVVTECFSELSLRERHELYDALAIHGYRLFNLAGYGPWIGGASEPGCEVPQPIGRDDMMHPRHFDVLAVASERVGELGLPPAR